MPRKKLIPTPQELKSMSPRELAEKYQVTPRAAQLWKYGKGGKRGKPNAMRERTDAMLQAGKSTKEIMAKVGCCKSYVSERRRCITQSKVHPSPSKHDDSLAPFVPLAKRYDDVLQAKARNIGKDIQWIKTVWVPQHPEYRSMTYAI